MESYDRKPQTVEAEQFVGGAESAQSVMDYVAQFGATSSWSEPTSENGWFETLTITTMQGTLILAPTHWFVRDELNQFRGMQDDAFRYTYITEEDDV